MFYFFLIMIAGVVMWFLLTSPAKKQPQHDDHDVGGELLRGVRILSTSHTAEVVVRKAGRDGLGMTLAGVTLAASADVTSYLFQGAPRSGKSLSFIQALTHARENNHRAIVVDNGSEFLRRFYREGDIILNPFDSRSASISLFNEIENDWDCFRLAKSIMPDSDNPTENEWLGYAQSFLASVMMRLWNAGGESATTKELVRVLTVAPIPELEEICKGLPGAAILSQDKMFGSVRTIIGSKLAAYTYLKSTGPFFSLTDFIRTEGSQFVFLTYNATNEAMLKPLIATQLDILISANLSITESRARRIYYAIDEFSSLGRINSILPLLERGAKYGCSTILGLQSVSQARSTFGHDMAQTIFSCLGTWLCLRSPDPDTAEFISRVLGKSEIRRTTQSASGSGDGVGWSESVLETPAIMPSQLQALDNCEGYLKIVGSFHPARIRVPYAEEIIQEKAPAFVLRDFKGERAAIAAHETAQVAQNLDDNLFQSKPGSLFGDLDAIQQAKPDEQPRTPLSNHTQDQPLGGLICRVAGVSIKPSIPDCSTRSTP